MAVKVRKRGEGKIGEKVKAPGGKYIHERKATPKKGADYVTIKKSGKLIRLMEVPGRTKKGRRKFVAQAVLSPVKGKKKK
jgi:hypothetical protein